MVILSDCIKEFIRLHPETVNTKLILKSQYESISADFTQNKDL